MIGLNNELPLIVPDRDSNARIKTPEDVREREIRKKSIFFPIPFFLKNTNLKIPIRLQLSLGVVFIIVLAVVILSFGMFERQRNTLYYQTVKIGTVTLNYFENNAAIPLLENDVLSLNNLLKESTAVEGILYAFILDFDGRIAAHIYLTFIN